MKHKSKRHSAGVIVTNGEQIVLGRVTNSKFWDIPKGRLDAGEVAIQAAVRELREETGLMVHAQDLITLGIYNYKPHKDLHVFLWCVPHMPDPQHMHCDSKFQGPQGWQPELDAFALVHWQDLAKYCNANLLRVLRILEKQARKLCAQQLNRG